MNVQVHVKCRDAVSPRISRFTRYLWMTAFDFLMIQNSTEAVCESKSYGKCPVEEYLFEDT